MATTTIDYQGRQFHDKPSSRRTIKIANLLHGEASDAIDCNGYSSFVYGIHTAHTEGTIDGNCKVLWVSADESAMLETICEETARHKRPDSGTEAGFLVAPPSQVKIYSNGGTGADWTVVLELIP